MDYNHFLQEKLDDWDKKESDSKKEKEDDQNGNQKSSGDSGDSQGRILQANTSNTTEQPKKKENKLDSEKMLSFNQYK